MPYYSPGEGVGPYYSKALDSLLVVPLPVLAWVLMLLEFVMLPVRIRNLPTSGPCLFTCKVRWAPLE